MIRQARVHGSSATYIAEMSILVVAPHVTLLHDESPLPELGNEIGIRFHRLSQQISNDFRPLAFGDFDEVVEDEFP